MPKYPANLCYDLLDPCTDRPDHWVSGTGAVAVVKEATRPKVIYLMNGSIERARRKNNNNKEQRSLPTSHFLTFLSSLLYIGYGYPVTFFSITACLVELLLSQLFLFGKIHT